MVAGAKQEAILPSYPNKEARKLLMIAFHYPPLSGGSGIQRTLKFSRYLPDHGWQPVVLSANAKAFPQTGDDLIHEVPDNVSVRRAFALDTARHLSLFGSYLNWMALPDRWVSWWLGGVPAGLRLIRYLSTRGYFLDLSHRDGPFNRPDAAPLDGNPMGCRFPGLDDRRDLSGRCFNSSMLPLDRKPSRSL